MWILVTAVLIPQEFASTAVVFVLALQNHFPIWLINIIWISATGLDMYVGYTIGKFSHERLQGTRFFGWAEKWISKLKSRLGKHGEKFGIAILGIFDFPYLNTFIAAWIGLPMRDALVLTFIGNFFWYAFLWATVLGLSSFISNPDIIILILIVVGVFSHLLFRFSAPKEQKDPQPKS
jgi:membrane protein YqaA with SNARE-associated domain